MTWLPAMAAGETEFARVFGLCPELYEDYRAFVSLLGSLQPVDRIILELCRLRVKQLLGEDGSVHTPDRVADASGPGADNSATAKSFTEVSAYPSIHGPKDGPLLGMNGFQEMRTVRTE